MTSWPAVLGPLTRREQLPEADIRWAMHEIMSGAATPAQVSAFVVSLRMRGETATDIAALVDVMLEFAVRIHPGGPAIDTCGTGGDGAHTVNISTMAAILLASHGARVVKHGNRAASSKCGSADVLEALGVKIDLSPERTQEVLDTTGLTFCFAPTFHPALRHAGPTRREIGIPTVFNFLGPLANPAQPAAQIVGVADATKAPLIADVLRLRGTKAIVLRGDDGLDEASIFAPTTCWATWVDGAFTITPADFGIGSYAADVLAGGDAAFNADIARRLLDGDVESAMAPIADAVALNAAIAHVAWTAATVVQPTDVRNAIVEAFPVMRTQLASGAAGATLRTWIASTQS